MDVRCDKCDSEYELDDTRVTTQGVNVKCTSCGHVFRVTKAAPTRGAITGDWMIRGAGGQVFKFKELTTLQRWIVERRVTRDDEISKTGETWKRLGDILELASFFQVAEQAAIVPQQQGGPTRETPSGRIVPTRRRSNLPIILAASVIGLALIAAAFLMRTTIAGLLKEKAPVAKSQSGTEMMAKVHITSGQRELKKDTIAGYAAAESEFEKALQLQPSNTTALAGATFALAGAADYSRTDGAAIDATLKEAVGKNKLAPTEIASLSAELANKQADAKARTERAFAYMKRTLEADLTLKDGLRAASRYYALANTQESFNGIADQATAILADDPAFNYSLGLLRSNDETQLEAAVQAFQKALEKEPDHLGARFRLAAIFAKRGDRDRALGLVDEVLRQAPDHSHALALKKELNPPKVEAKPEEPKTASAPESFETLVNRANKARQSERSRQALDLYGRALELRPDNVEALTGLGFVYLDMDQAGNAISQFQKATAANSRFSDAFMGLAEAYRARGQKRDAVKNYQRYLDLAPDGAEANVARQALKDLGQE